MSKFNGKAKNNSEPTTRLIGWLVSYGLDDNGAAYEIRAGRCLLGRSGAEGAISLEDDSISSPHLALNATTKHRVMVQDIFSEHGSYLKRGDADKESTISGPVEISHGDWLRIGNSTRFQVCLIDGPRR